MNSLESSIIYEIEKAIIKAYNIRPDTSILEKSLVICDDLSKGHYTLKCFNLAKVFRASPLNIANTLSENISDDNLFNAVDAVNGYLNFKIKVDAIAKEAFSTVSDKKRIERKKKVIIEYSQPNTHKELHVGHMRNLCLGNSLCRIKTYLGYNVVSATYPGDVGTHVAKCLWYIKKHYNGELPIHNKGEWLGHIYSTANMILKEQESDEVLNGKNKNELTLILKEIESRSGSYHDLWRLTREWSLDLMKSIYTWANVSFDKWYFESDVDRPSIDLCNNLYSEGKLIKSDGAIGMDLEKLNLGFCMLIKSDGTGLYAAKDIELAKIKHDNFKPDQSIYIVDNRQSYHFEQVFAVLEQIGFEDSSKCIHLKYEMVELPDGAMSSRKGNIVPISRLINDMEDTITKKYLSNSSKNWDSSEIKLAASKIANGAIKYGMLKFDPNKKIIFDLNEWLKTDGDTGPYIQYAATRARSILSNTLGFNIEYNDINDICFTYNYDIEVELLIKLISFNDIIERADLLNKPSIIANYTYELAQIFNRFYAKVNIKNISDQLEKNQRLILVGHVYNTIEEGLNLLGIDIPARM
ncbi:arginine--tRNA ligase [Aliivibrio fischeri]|uniref:arginine--tRNA ligase n=1 Tax=Aliivibrio fischeri TaxID=668 RepID=UPI001EEE5BBE|nr:arginine--tRNA ligase [Aliivibrio fischeri]MCE7578148.1 arginine--tRNA ligase [Aliivibrio fischeri]MCE7590535.1 arginine--tRNA ligase [Aliivibrio fischeri]